jgi:hypothetical protein
LEHADDVADATGQALGISKEEIRRAIRQSVDMTQKRDKHRPDVLGDKVGFEGKHQNQRADVAKCIARGIDQVQDRRFKARAAQTMLAAEIDEKRGVAAYCGHKVCDKSAIDGEIGWAKGPINSSKNVWEEMWVGCNGVNGRACGAEVGWRRCEDDEGPCKALECEEIGSELRL